MFFRSVQNQDFLKHASRSKPDSSWVVHRITIATVCLYFTQNFSISSAEPLPKTCFRLDMVSSRDQPRQEVADVHTSIESALTCLKNELFSSAKNHAQELEGFQDFHQAEINKLQASHESEIIKLQMSYKSEINQLQTSHKSEIKPTADYTQVRDQPTADFAQVTDQQTADVTRK